MSRSDNTMPWKFDGRAKYRYRQYIRPGRRPSCSRERAKRIPRPYAQRNPDTRGRKPAEPARELSVFGDVAPAQPWRPAAWRGAS